MNETVWPTLVKVEPPQPYALVTATASEASGPLCGAVRDAFQDAMAMRGRLREDAMQVKGFSGRKFRLFMNNLMSEVPDPRYLEIGLFHGASFCSALYKNKLTAVGVDNWTEYGGKREGFDANLAKFRSNETQVSIIEKDFRKVDYADIGSFNVLFYDGSHAEKDQFDGIFMPQPALDANSIIIVDDWNWEHVRRGTFRAFKEANLQIRYSVEVRTTFNGEPLPLVNGHKSEWHNGCIVAVITK